MKETEQMKDPRIPVLYHDAFWKRDLRKATESLTELLTRFQKPCVIHVPLATTHGIERRRLAAGQLVSREAVMNYGYILGLHTTYIFDDRKALWYEICNKRPAEKVIWRRSVPF